MPKIQTKNYFWFKIPQHNFSVRPSCCAAWSTARSMEAFRGQLLGGLISKIPSQTFDEYINITRCLFICISWSYCDALRGEWPAPKVIPVLPTLKRWSRKKWWRAIICCLKSRESTSTSLRGKSVFPTIQRLMKQQKKTLTSECKQHYKRTIIDKSTGNYFLFFIFQVNLREWWITHLYVSTNKLMS